MSDQGRHAPGMMNHEHEGEVSGDAEYDEPYRGVRERIFSHDREEWIPFRLPWRFVPLPGGLILDRDIFSAIREAASFARDAEFVIVDRLARFRSSGP